MTEGYLGLKSVRFGHTKQAVDDIMQLHFPEALTVADLTYGKGRFWPTVRQDRPDLRIVGLDVDVRRGAEVCSDYRWVPLRDQSVDVAAFDPSFIFTPGIRTLGTLRYFAMTTEPGVPFFHPTPKNADDLHVHTVLAMLEMRRIARTGMILKGQNLVTTTHPNWWTHRTIATGLELLGIWPEDELIQVSPMHRNVDPRWKHQYHFRRADCRYLIWRW